MYIFSNQIGEVISFISIQIQSPSLI